MSLFQNVIPALSQALEKRGYKVLTEVQNSVLAPELIDSDLLVSAQTGSGKTVAFGLGIAPTLLGESSRFGRVDAPLALVIAPTRELALQVTRELEWLYAESGAEVISCVGGMDMRTERNALKRNPHIVVGTPGRLKDHIERGYFDTSALKAVVLDEADEMLDMGFRDELQYILDTAPVERRTLLFSATVPRSIVSMAKEYQRDAIRIATKEEQKQHGDITYQALTIAPSDRENAIINLLRYHDAQNAIIFCATRAAVNHLTSRLTNRGFSVVALSGELSQSERTNALQALRDGRAKVCVATDVASRGIDLPGLALVVHADIPKNSEILLHRSGRTGRAGSKGVSALVVPHNARSRTDRLLKAAKIEAVWQNPPSIQDILDRDNERFLANPVLHDAITDEESSAVAALLEKFSSEQLAAALLRLHNKQKPAPEELLDTAPADAPRSSRDGFENSVWVSLSVGRNASAEARWLLPMLCGAGHLTKRQIGAIRINETTTDVELTASCVDKFFAAVGPSGKMEKDIVVRRLDGTPVESSRGGRPERSSSKRSNDDYVNRKKPQSRGKSFERSDSGGGYGDKKKFDDRAPRGDRPYGRSADGDGSKPAFKKKFDDRSPRGERSYGRSAEGDGAKPAFKKKFDDRAPRGERPYGRSAEGDGSKPAFKKKFDDRAPRGERPYGRSAEGDGSKPAFKKKFDDRAPRGERPYGRSAEGDGSKPAFKKKFDDRAPRGERSFDKSSDRRDGKLELKVKPKGTFRKSVRGDKPSKASFFRDDSTKPNRPKD